MESANENYSKHGMKADKPGEIRRDDVSSVHPATANTQSGKPEIKESGLGRDASQKPQDEHPADFTQIDPESADAASVQTREKEFDTDDSQRVDARDNKDSSADWDAEKSRTGRHR